MGKEPWMRQIKSTGTENLRGEDLPSSPFEGSLSQSSYEIFLKYAKGDQDGNHRDERRGGEQIPLNEAPFLDHFVQGDRVRPD